MSTAKRWRLGFINYGPDGNQYFEKEQRGNYSDCVIAELEYGAEYNPLTREGVILRSVSTGYGGETDLDATPEDLALMALAPEMADMLVDLFMEIEENPDWSLRSEMRDKLAALIIAIKEVESDTE